MSWDWNISGRSFKFYIFRCIDWYIHLFSKALLLQKYIYLLFFVFIKRRERWRTELLTYKRWKVKIWYKIYVSVLDLHWSTVQNRKNASRIRFCRINNCVIRWKNRRENRNDLTRCSTIIMLYIHHHVGKWCYNI